MIEGRATPEGTAAFASARGAGLAEDFYREVLGLRLSNLGLGSYLGPSDAATDAGYREALKSWTKGGVNVVDTAINYRGQGSERALGAGLRDLLEAGELSREQVFVATKGGFNPQDRDDAERGGAALLKGIPPEEVVRGSHCLNSRYLERVLARSRDNLGLQTLDLYYLHNPETQLGEASKPIFYDRIRRAFAVLEAARERGELASYGVATWAGFRLAPGDPAALNLQRLLEAARAVGGEDHGLKVIQLPFSLALPEAMTLPSQRVGEELLPAIPAARALGLQVITSGPLAQGKLMEREVPPGARLLGGERTRAQHLLHLARSAGDCALVGTANPRHAEENLLLARESRSARADLLRALAS